MYCGCFRLMGDYYSIASPGFPGRNDDHSTARVCLALASSPSVFKCSPHYFTNCSLKGVVGLWGLGCWMRVGFDVGVHPSTVGMSRLDGKILHPMQMRAPRGVGTVLYCDVKSKNRTKRNDSESLFRVTTYVSKVISRALLNFYIGSSVISSAFRRNEWVFSLFCGRLYATHKTWRRELNYKKKKLVNGKCTGNTYVYAAMGCWPVL